MGSFCTPAIATGYPRWRRPDELKMPHAHRPQHGLADTGEYVDAFGHKVSVDAAGNPVAGRAPNRSDEASEKGSGFGFITFDPVKKTYAIDSLRFLIDATAGKASNPFPGWPVTIHKAENRGQNQLER